MRAGRSDKVHASAWALSIMAVPLLYLLGAPPLFNGISAWCARTGRPAPSWHLDVITPYCWLCLQTPLEKPLEAYFVWWWMRLDPNARPGVSPFLE